MLLLVTFLALALFGQAANFFIAIQVERYSEAAAVIVFFALLVLVFIGAWKLAVRFTEPASERQALRQRHG